MIKITAEPNFKVDKGLIRSFSRDDRHWPHKHMSAQHHWLLGKCRSNQLTPFYAIWDDYALFFFTCKHLENILNSHSNLKGNINQY